MESFGKYLVVVGAALIIVGVLLMFFDKIPFLGKLPGDIQIKRENFRFFFPITTSILLSVVISVVLWLINHFRK